jgi:hypothetical protein
MQIARDLGTSGVAGKPNWRAAFEIQSKQDRILGTSRTIRRELPLSHRAVIPPQRDQKRRDAFRPRKAKLKTVRYRKRKATGLCTHGHCPTKAEPGHTHCRKHLQAMVQRASERRRERIVQGLCLYCGKRPQFWGRRCIICRQLFAKDPLPSGARRALRLYREAEKRSVPEQIRREAQAEARKLLASGKVYGRSAEALRLYMGLDDGKWRSHGEVGGLMNLSAERVRQLLEPSKRTLIARLSGRVPWRTLKDHESNGDVKMDTSLSTACTRCNNIALKIVDHESYLYEDCGLPNVVLSGLSIDHCQACNSETVSLPRIPDLRRELAKTVLLKPAALTGREFRFLRAVAGLSTLLFAEQLGIVTQTIQAWERCEALRYLNDLGARVVIASLIAPDEDWSPIFKILSSIKDRRSEADRLSAQWVREDAHWVVTLPGASD